MLRPAVGAGALASMSLAIAIPNTMHLRGWGNVMGSSAVMMGGDIAVMQIEKVPEMSLFSSSRADQSQSCETPDEKYQRKNKQEKRRGWDSNPSVPYDTTGLEPAAYRLHGV